MYDPLLWVRERREQGRILHRGTERYAVQLWELEAKLDVEDLIKRYACLGDRAKLAEMAALFTADGVFETAGGRRARGREGVLKLLEGTPNEDTSAGRPTAAASSAGGFVRHNMTNILVTIEGPERATASSYLFTINGGGFGASGRYRDRLMKTPEGWRFEYRSYRPDAPTG